jgi:hypothetical protein
VCSSDLGDRSAAAAHYRSAAAGPDPLGLRARAQACLTQPCSRQDTLDFLRLLSRE